MDEGNTFRASKLAFWMYQIVNFLINGHIILKFKVQDLISIFLSDFISVMFTANWLVGYIRSPSQ